ncbi:MAG TPA: DUF3108 domain-containing protein [bacterium]|nr:DUF3108 domain-containing protein [bacterium]
MKMKKLMVITACLFMTACASTGKKHSVIEVERSEGKLKEVAVERVKDEEKAAPKAATHKVSQGESLWKIARERFGSGALWPAIAKANAVTEPYIIRPGQKLVIPDEVEAVLAVRKREAVKPFEYRSLENRAYAPGEKLKFAVRYFGVTAGFGILEVKDMVTYRGRMAYHLEATARTAPFFERFYRVKDVITSYMDAEGLFAWKYSKNLEEGSYRHKSHMEFFHKEGYALKSDNTRCVIPPFVQDILSEFYYFRSVYKGEDEIFIDVASDECKTYRIVVKKTGYEKVRVDAGEFDCVIIQPFLQYEGIFKQAGDVLIWVTNDERMMPVLVKSKIAIGTIDAVLVEARVVK